MKTFFLNLQFIFKLHYWGMNHEYDKRLDYIINKLLDDGEIINVDEHTCNISGVTIWIGSYPFAYGRLYGHGLFDLCRPSRLTIQRLRKATKASQAASIQKNMNDFLDTYLKNIAY